MLSQILIRVLLCLYLGLISPMLWAKQPSKAMSPPARELYYFISFSMPTHLIQQYLEDADRYGGTLVLRGIDAKMTLKQFILARLLPLLQSQSHQADIIIDPNLFEQYHITLVPSIVVNAPPNQAYKVSGAVSTDWVLKHAPST